MKLLLTLFLLSASLFAQSIKDISNIVGIRDNQLIGYGLVVGLSGTGDKSQFTMQSLQNLLRNSYIKIPTSSIKSKNIAAVMVTAMLPAFSRQGDKIRIKISAIGDAKSINNGELLLTQLKGVDGNVYALAQGKIVASQGNLTTGFIYEGATIENEINYNLKDETSLTLSLLQNSAKNAATVEDKINQHFGTSLAYATDTRTIEVKRPQDISMVKFISIIEGLRIDSDIKKKVIIDIHTGMIIAGANVVIQPVTVVRDNFTIRIQKTPLNPKDWNNPMLNKGEDIGDDIKLGGKPVKVTLDNVLMNSKKLPTVADLLRTMKVMKVPVSDIVETLKLIKDLGALDVDLEIRR
ncbi:MAG: flagellar basal body P-ring protein FlgI [Campylobacterota bacterium]|nr:flagellar basal body P-ring protein FlgI [Campylobacterota bacterium]